MINVLDYVGPPHRLLIEGEVIRCYETDEPLGAAEVFNTAKIRDHVYDTLVGGEWIAWGAARYIRAIAQADQVSAANGFKIEYTLDGETVEGVIDQAALAVDTEYDSGWMPRLGIGFRFSITNGATPQGNLTATVEVRKSFPVSVGGPILDNSGTIAAAATPEVIQAVEPDLTYLEIANPDEDTVAGEVLCYTINGDAPVLGAAGTITLQPSMSRIYEGNKIPRGPITMKSQTDGAPYTLHYAMGA